MRTRHTRQFKWDEVPDASVPAAVRGCITSLYFCLLQRAEPEDLGFNISEVRQFAERLILGLDRLNESVKNHPPRLDEGLAAPGRPKGQRFD